MLDLESAAAATRVAIADLHAAQRTADATVGPLANAREAHAKLVGRIGEKRAEHDAIAAERGAGVDHPDHAGRVGLIAMDVANLQPIIARAQDVLQAASEAHSIAQRAVVGATADLEQAKIHEVTVRLLQQRAVLRKAMASNVERLGEEVAKLDHRRIGGVVPVLIADAQSEQAAMVKSVNLLVGIHRGFGVGRQSWPAAPGFEEVPRKLVAQLGMA